MRKKIFLLFFLLAGLAVFSLFVPDRLLGKDAFVSTIIVSRAEAEPANPAFSWPDKIKEGQELLRLSPPLKYVEKSSPIYKSKKIVGHKKEIQRQEIAIAIMNNVNGQIFEKRFWLDAKEIKKGNANRRQYLESEESIPEFVPESIYENFVVKVRWWNNFNSDLSVTRFNSTPEDQDSFVVIANKFLMDNDNLAYPEDQNAGQKY